MWVLCVCVGAMVFCCNCDKEMVMLVTAAAAAVVAPTLHTYPRINVMLFRSL